MMYTSGSFSCTQSSQHAHRFLQTVDIAEIFAGLLDTLSEGFLTLTHPNTRVVELCKSRQ
jgi:hypothetical protein